VLFSSVTFLFYFLPLLLVLYYIVPRTWAKNVVLFAASVGFYAWGAGKLVALLLAVGLLAWVFSYLISKSRRKKTLLIIAIITFLGVLIDGLIYVGAESLPELKILLPAGVSFFIFQAISYNIDVYRKPSRFEKNPAYVILYVCMFPQLLSGPLVRYHALEAQFRKRSFDFDLFVSGIRRFIIGLGKKVLLADPIGKLVDQIMDLDAYLISPSLAWIGIIAFTIQLYFDFSGYTDMAVGVGRMLGFKLPENFNFPYISKSISEFWRRWHMSLSNWLADYLFMPLSLSFRRLKKAGVFLALMITFTLCGIWHQPGWNFLIWGAIHGLFLGLEAIFLKKYLEKIKVVSILYTLLIIVTSFVFVRTDTVQEALMYLSLMFTPAGEMALGPASFVANQHIVLLALGVLFCLPIHQGSLFKRKRLAGFFKVSSVILLIFVFLLSAMAVTSQTFNPFLYFKF
jgi:alginate O-acetyltransferase complex protein AlgI